MKKCRCGNTRFYAKKMNSMRIIIDEEGNLIDELNDQGQEICGPYICTKCGTDYYSLEELSEWDNTITVTLQQKIRASSSFRITEEEYLEIMEGSLPDRIMKEMIKKVKKIEPTELDTDYQIKESNGQILIDWPPY